MKKKQLKLEIWGGEQRSPYNPNPNVGVKNIARNE
jgi:hypothetical protein